MGGGGRNEREEESRLKAEATAAARTLGRYKGLEQAPRENEADVRRKTEAVTELLDRAYRAAAEAGDPKSREEVAAALVNKMVDAIRANHEREHGRPLTEDELRPLPGFLYPLRACGSFTFRDKVRGDASVKYRDAQRDGLLAWVRRAAENCRRHRHALHPTDCAEKQEVFGREEELARERRDAEEKLRDEY